MFCFRCLFVKKFALCRWIALDSIDAFLELVDAYKAVGEKGCVYVRVANVMLRLRCDVEFKRRRNFD